MTKSSILWTDTSAIRRYDDPGVFIVSEDSAAYGPHRSGFTGWTVSLLHCAQSFAEGFAGTSSGNVRMTSSESPSHTTTAALIVLCSAMTIYIAFYI